MAAEALYNAVQNGSIEDIQKLLEDGVDINSKVNNHGFTALHCAVCDNKEEIVSFLLEKGADPRARKDNGATPFITAGITGNVRLLELLLDSRERINEYDFNGFTALMEAAWYGKEEALKFLYGCGADVNFTRVVDKEKRALNRGGRTALMDAAENGHVAVVKALVEEMEADVNICDNKDRNALVHALSMTKNKNWDQDKEAIALFLLQHGADVNKKDASERTTLILAVENQSQKLVKALLEKEQVDINAADKNGRTALMVATEKKNWDIAKTLCEKGARTDIGDPIGIARRTYNLEMVNLLQQYGAMASSSQPQKHWTPISKHWGPKLQELYGKSCVAIGKLRIYKANCDFRILETSQGGVYLGFYDEKEVAVKIFKSESENAKCEKTCLEKCRTTSKYLVKFYGSEEENACLYICLSLCEKNLEEYLKTSNHATLKSEDILRTVFQAVQELHMFGFGHQDLHPRNILIDVDDRVFLADFDKCRKLTDDEKDLIIKEDLKALSKLVVYIAMRGKACFEDLPTDCPDSVEVKDLKESLSSFNENTPVHELLERLIYHPYFWTKQMKYRFLRDVGNEARIQKNDSRRTEGQKEILNMLNCEEDPFKDWKEKIHKDVLDDMINQGDKKKKKKNQCKILYENCVTDLLKLIRNVGEHFEEKSPQIRDIIKEPREYFLTLFPNLPIYIYQKLRNTQYEKHFPNAQSTSLL